MGQQANYSEEVAAHIDSEVRRLLDEAHAEARDVLITYRSTLDKLAEALVAKETLDTPEVMEILADVPKRPQRPAATSVASNRRVRPISTN